MSELIERIAIADRLRGLAQHYKNGGALIEAADRIEELEADKAELAEEAGDGLYQAEYDGRMEELC